VTKDDTELVRSQFGASAPAYATSDVHAKGESLTRILQLAAPQHFWRILDVATGAGHMAAAFAPHVAQVVASDITDEMLSEASKLAADKKLANMSTAKAEAGALPFEDASFDLVCCRLAAHHFPDLGRFVAEVRRVLKDDGRFALVDNVAPDAQQLPGASPSEIKDADAAYNAFEKLRDPSHALAPPPETWIRLLEGSGFRVVAKEQFGKELDFPSWVTRMRCAPDTIIELRRILTSGPQHLRSFLQPRIDEAGALHFTLQELLVVADKIA